MKKYQIKLEIFEGPFDLLLHLIKKEKLNIYDIPIARITRDYLEYLNLMKSLDIDLASEFLVMAAYLLSLKSRMLLPQPKKDDQTEIEEQDPKTELANRLLEYQRYKKAAEELQEKFLKQQQIMTKAHPIDRIQAEDEVLELEVDLYSLVTSFVNLLKKEETPAPMEIIAHSTTIFHRMEEIEHALKAEGRISFFALLKKTFKKADLIVTLLALLELVRLRKIVAKQEQAFSDIWIFCAE
ncbi:MAG: segregation/condensation protein A [bacterium]|nr:segregation/condensation protein A [bacterium]